MGGPHRLGDGCRRSGVAGYGGPRRRGSVGGRLAPPIAADYNVVMDGTSRWLGGGPFYLPEQLDGPYTWPGPWMLYPPPMLLLFAPFTVLPAVLWWAIPLGAIAWVIARHRPRPLALGVIALCIVNPTSISTIYWGNPGLWMAAAVALATVYGWPAVLVLLKPTLLPFALLGIRRRSWWLSIGALSGRKFPLPPDVVRVHRGRWECATSGFVQWPRLLRLANPAAARAGCCLAW